jgi:dTDP-4-dehydrorhamnose 3,5-epimerase
VQARPLTIPHAWEFTPEVHSDERGKFHEFYRFEKLEETVGHSLSLRQGNTSVSHMGVVRGVHYAQLPLGQAKYVTAVRGALLDYIVDLRVGSPTFGEWDCVLLDDVAHRSVYLAEGLGHAILALEANTTVSYLVSGVYNPAREFAVTPFDVDLALDYAAGVEPRIVAAKDREAPTLSAALDSGLLPNWQTCLDLYAALAVRSP